MVQKEFDKEEARKIMAGEKLGFIMTRLGIEVRIVCWDCKGPRPIVALMKQADGTEKPRLFREDGGFDVRPGVRSSADLILEVEGGEA